MKQSFKSVPGSVTAPQGFLAAGVFCDIKRLGTGKGSQQGPRSATSRSSSPKRPPPSPGMFTTSQVCAAPVKVSLPRAKKAARPGHRRQFRQRQRLHRRAGLARRPRDDGNRRQDASACRAEDVLVASTGRIGVTLPMANVKRGIQRRRRLAESFAENAASRRRGHHDQRHAAEGSRRGIQAGRPDASASAASAKARA